MKMFSSVCDPGLQTYYRPTDPGYEDLRVSASVSEDLLHSQAIFCLLFGAKIAVQESWIVCSMPAIKVFETCWRAYKIVQQEQRLVHRSDRNPLPFVIGYYHAGGAVSDASGQYNTATQAESFLEMLRRRLNPLAAPFYGLAPLDTRLAPEAADFRKMLWEEVDSHIQGVARPGDRLAHTPLDSAFIDASQQGFSGELDYGLGITALSEFDYNFPDSSRFYIREHRVALSTALPNYFNKVCLTASSLQPGLSETIRNTVNTIAGRNISFHDYEGMRDCLADLSEADRIFLIALTRVLVNRIVATHMGADLYQQVIDKTAPGRVAETMLSSCHSIARDITQVDATTTNLALPRAYVGSGNTGAGCICQTRFDWTNVWKRVWQCCLDPSWQSCKEKLQRELADVKIEDISGHHAWEVLFDHIARRLSCAEIELGLSSPDGVIHFSVRKQYESTVRDANVYALLANGLLAFTPVPLLVAFPLITLLAVLTNATERIAQRIVVNDLKRLSLGRSLAEISYEMPYHSLRVAEQ